MYNKLKGFISETSTSIAFCRESRGIQNIGVHGIAHPAMEVIIAGRLHIGRIKSITIDTFGTIPRGSLASAADMPKGRNCPLPTRALTGTMLIYATQNPWVAIPTTPCPTPKTVSRRMEDTGRLSICKESRKMIERRHQARDLESKHRQREWQGLRRHFLSVNEDGIPYGPRVGSWRAELSKLCMALNPAVMDIWWQPSKDMKLLQERLAENSEYSDEVCDNYIRRLARNVVTQRRSKLWRQQR
jgi:hypothetical protein